MVASTLVIQEQCTAMQADRVGICLVDTSSAVRHICFDMFSAIGCEVCVFYSPETFIHSGAASSVDILILGHTRIPLKENEPLRWIGTCRPEIKTIVLGDGPTVVHRLLDLFDTPSIAAVHENSLDRIRRLARALHLFCDSCRNARIYLTILPRVFAGSCIDISTHTSQQRLGRDQDCFASCNAPSVNYSNMTSWLGDRPMRVNQTCSFSIDSN
jgi:hypothetical protein